MKKFISISAWLSVVCTTLCLVLTMLSSYEYMNLDYFNNYYVLEVSIIITMFLWSIKQFHIKRGEWINSALCMFMGVVTVIFMAMEIY